MATPDNLDGILITWGDRLFYPGNRVVKVKPLPRLSGDAARQRAAVIRQRIEATVVRRAPQVMVKVTGGGRGLRAIAAHFRYISKNGRLEIEDQRGEIMRGKDVLHDLAEEWRFSGSYIPDVGEPGHRREAFNIMLSMPRGIDPLAVQRAAREFAQVELKDHKYVLVLHDHQANPHVHISVRAESMLGQRLNPRKADLHRWRETFAEKLRGHGVDAEATRQATRGRNRKHDDLWRIKARQEGRLLTTRTGAKSSSQARTTRSGAAEAWVHVGDALARSGDSTDRELARSIAEFTREMFSSQMQTSPRRSPEFTQPQIPRDVGPRR
jgi:hypothetical protein